MSERRIERLNSLLKEVISEVIRNDVKNPFITKLFTITSVAITKDLHHAKVYVSVIGTEKDKKDTLDALHSAAGFIAIQASKKVVMRFFPSLTFFLDTTVDKQLRIHEILEKIETERHHQNESSE